MIAFPYQKPPIDDYVASIEATYQQLAGRSAAANLAFIEYGMVPISLGKPIVDSPDPNVEAIYASMTKSMDSMRNLSNMLAQAQNEYIQANLQLYKYVLAKYEKGGEAT